MFKHHDNGLPHADELLSTADVWKLIIPTDALQHVPFQLIRYQLASNHIGSELYLNLLIVLAYHQLGGVCQPLYFLIAVVHHVACLLWVLLYKVKETLSVYTFAKLAVLIHAISDFFDGDCEHFGLAICYDRLLPQDVIKHYVGSVQQLPLLLPVKAILTYPLWKWSFNDHVYLLERQVPPVSNVLALLDLHRRRLRQEFCNLLTRQTWKYFVLLNECPGF